MPILLRTDFDALRMRAAAKAAKDGPQARRLLALAAIYDGGPRSEAAKIGGVTLQIVRDWVVKFNAHGPDGFVDRKSPGRPARLNAAHRAAVAAVLLFSLSPYNFLSFPPLTLSSGSSTSYEQVRLDPAATLAHRREHQPVGLGRLGLSAALEPGLAVVAVPDGAPAGDALAGFTTAARASGGSWCPGCGRPPVRRVLPSRPCARG